jgi:hypothetical protein
MIRELERTAGALTAINFKISELTPSFGCRVKRRESGEFRYWRHPNLWL